MDGNIITVMIGVSTFLGALGLGALLWGVKSGQFDDEEKFINAVKFDDEDALRDAYELENRKKNALKK